MKINLIKRKTIEQYALANAGSRISLRIWLTLLKMADWNEPEHMQHILNYLMGISNIQLPIIKLNYMMNLKYKIIKTDSQYNNYCDRLEELISNSRKTKEIREEIELLTLLIAHYDERNNSFTEADPIELLRSLMKEHKMKAVDLAKLLNVSEGLVSDMLNYKKGLSKETIRILSEKFKLNQLAFNRPYSLVISGKKN